MFRTCSRHAGGTYVGACENHQYYVCIPISDTSGILLHIWTFSFPQFTLFYDIFVVVAKMNSSEGGNCVAQIAYTQRCSNIWSYFTYRFNIEWDVAASLLVCISYVCHTFTAFAAVAATLLLLPMGLWFCCFFVWPRNMGCMHLHIYSNWQETKLIKQSFSDEPIAGREKSHCEMYYNIKQFSQSTFCSALVFEWTWSHSLDHYYIAPNLNCFSGFSCYSTQQSRFDEFSRLRNDLIFCELCRVEMRACAIQMTQSGIF